MLRSVKDMLKEKGFAPYNIDCTIVMQSPKLAPYIGIIRDTLAAALDMDVSYVSVKATTEEKLGFTGSGQGAAAHAVCTVIEIG